MDFPSILVALILGVPIALGTNLATPYVSRRLERMSAARLARQTAKARRQRTRAQFFLDNPDVFTQRMVLQVLRVGWYCAGLLAIVIGVLIPPPGLVPISAEDRAAMRPVAALVINTLVLVMFTRVFLGGWCETRSLSG